ncbi:MAG TPA: hypothetical protein VNO30_44465 [Kofleriaceae bacterium]|nr:hypothetical protein [Kofleriaceae bacterium]
MACRLAGTDDTDAVPALGGDDVEDTPVGDAANVTRRAGSGRGGGGDDALALGDDAAVGALDGDGEQGGGRDLELGGDRDDHLAGRGDVEDAAVDGELLVALLVEDPQLVLRDLGVVRTSASVCGTTGGKGIAALSRRGSLPKEQFADGRKSDAGGSKKNARSAYA